MRCTSPADSLSRFLITRQQDNLPPREEQIEDPHLMAAQLEEVVGDEFRARRAELVAARSQLKQQGGRLVRVTALEGRQEGPDRKCTSCLLEVADRPLIAARR